MFVTVDNDHLVGEVFERYIMGLFCFLFLLLGFCFVMHLLPSFVICICYPVLLYAFVIPFCYMHVPPFCCLLYAFVTNLFWEGVEGVARGLVQSGLYSVLSIYSDLVGLYFRYNICMNCFMW